jgi:hypothetical protein
MSGYGRVFLPPRTAPAVPFVYENKHTSEQVRVFLEDKKLSYLYQESNQNSSVDQPVS